ncbi:MAG: multidrug efflux MFS transporter [Ignavibacteria bacterium]|nr:multidrug efflux MFS transporter [Ignavibacteria bacterium]
MQVLWKRNLFFITVAQFIAMIGMSACVPFIPFFIRELGVENSSEIQLWSGLIFAGPYFLSIITVPIWGVLGDKYGRKLMILRALFGLAISVTLMGFAQNVTQLFALRVVQGAISGFIAAALSFVSANSPTEKTGYAIGILQSATSAGNIIGPFFGGIAADLWGVRYTFFIVGALCLVSGVLIFFFIQEKKIIPSKNLSNNIFLNLHFAVNKLKLGRFLLLIIISQAGIIFINPIFPLFVEQLNAPKEYLSTITGVLVGLVGLFSIVFAPTWGRRNDRKDYHKTLIVSSGICAIATILHILVPYYWMLFPLRSLIGVFFAALVPTLYSVLSKKTSFEYKGLVMGLASSSNLIGSLIGYSMCGIVASNLGMEACFVISATLLFLVAILTITDSKEQSPIELIKTYLKL